MRRMESQVKTSWQKFRITLRNWEPRIQTTEIQDKVPIVSCSPSGFDCYLTLLLFCVALYHGDTVALQSFRRDHWLGCSLPNCGGAACPGVFMTGSDWTHCWGEVFRIYRASGPGQVRVGDLVGLYHPYTNGHWFGCSLRECGKTTCPGQPTIAHGFAQQEKWYRCWGEVFKIYANSKSNGDIINLYDDDIMLYYLQDSSWVSQGYEGTLKSRCPGSSRPPSSSKYDRCSHEVFKIWKQH